MKNGGLVGEARERRTDIIQKTTNTTTRLPTLVQIQIQLYSATMQDDEDHARYDDEEEEEEEVCVIVLLFSLCLR